MVLKEPGKERGKKETVGKKEKREKPTETDTDESEGDGEPQTEEEKMSELVKRMLATGVSAEMMEKKLNSEDKQKQKTKNLGKGRGRGPRGGKIK